jgi:hypothetical protein
MNIHDESPFLVSGDEKNPVNPWLSVYLITNRRETVELAGYDNPRKNPFRSGRGMKDQ